MTDKTKKASKNESAPSQKQILKEMRRIWNQECEDTPNVDIGRSFKDNRVFFTDSFHVLKINMPGVKNLKGKDYDNCIIHCFQEYIDWQIDKFTITKTITIQADSLEDEEPEKGLLQ